MTNLFVMLIVKYLVIIVLLVIAVDFAMHKMKSKFRLSKWAFAKTKQSSFWFLRLPGRGVKSLWSKLRNRNQNKKGGGK